MMVILRYMNVPLVSIRGFNHHLYFFHVIRLVSSSLYFLPVTYSGSTNLHNA